MERTGYIGGSDMAIILGISPYKTPYQLWLDKLGRGKPFEETEQQYWGKLLEPIIRDEFARRNNVAVEYTDKPYCHPILDWAQGHLDGFIPDWNAVLEIKCSTAFKAYEWGEDGSDIIPMQYLAQVAYYCFLTNADSAYIAVLIDGNTYKQFEYTRDKTLETKLITAAEKFWEYVVKEIEPEPINIIDLKLKFPQHEPDKCIQINRDVAVKLEALADTKTKIKLLNELEEQTKFDIMKYMEDCEALTDVDGRPLVTYKANKRGSRVFLLKGI